MIKKFIKARATLTTLPLVGAIATLNPATIDAIEALLLTVVSIVVDFMGGLHK